MSVKMSEKISVMTLDENDIKKIIPRKNHNVTEIINVRKFSEIMIS